MVLAIVTDDPVVDLDTESSVEDARPAGAGSLPDGDAGLSNDALTNGADDSDFIAARRAHRKRRPPPSMEAPDMPETRVAPGEEQQTRGSRRQLGGTTAEAAVRTTEGAREAPFSVFGPWL